MTLPLCPAVKTAQIKPCYNDRGHILLYDMYIGGRWRGSCRELAHARVTMNRYLVEEIRAWYSSRKHTSKGVSSDAAKDKQHEIAF